MLNDDAAAIKDQYRAATKDYPIFIITDGVRVCTGAYPY
jgi:hypothetical protein